MSKSIFITGTGTDVGKTYVTALIVKKLKDAGLSCGYYKAAVSGNIRDEHGKLIPGDAACVKEISGISQDLEDMCPYVYEHAYSPHLASRIEGNPVSLPVVIEGYEKTCKSYDYVTMEGSGGILCPIDFDENKIWLWEMVKELNLSCVIVADAGLGTINNVGLTVAFLKEKGISVKGIIFNHYHPGDICEEDNIRMCEYLTGVNVIACVKDNDTELDIEIEKIIELYEEN